VAVDIEVQGGLVHGKAEKVGRPELERFGGPRGVHAERGQDAPADCPPH